MLGEPTNDLDIDTLTVVEDYLDTWPGTLIVVSHDRYFLERVCDVTYALLGDGRCVLLPGGVDQYLELRHAAERAGDSGPRSAGSGRSGSGGVGSDDHGSDGSAAGESATQADSPTALSAAGARQARKDLARIESQLSKLETRITRLHAQMAESASDYTRLAELQRELTVATDEQSELEETWLLTADALS